MLTHDASPEPGLVATCVECKAQFRFEEVIILGGFACCSSCKPIRLQKLREGCLEILPNLAGSPDLFRITYHSSLAAQLRCNFYVMFHKKQAVLLNVAFILLVSVIVPLQVFPSMAINVFTTIASAVAAALLFVTLFVLAICLRYPKSRSCTTGFTAEGVFDLSTAKRQGIPWRQIKEIREKSGDVHIWRGLGGIYIPREAFKDLDEARRLAGLAKELWLNNR